MTVAGGQRWFDLIGQISAEFKVQCCDLVPTQSTRDNPYQDEHAEPIALRPGQK